ncbi:MAG: ribokinase [Rectinemataceae bacterium]|nr:ribokinase [Rectinemataceae bacterium]
MALVCVAGSVNADIVVSVDRLTMPGETITGSRLEYHPGGKGANQALAALRAGSDLRFAANVGEDQFASLALSALEAAGAPKEYLRSVRGAPTGVALIRVAADGENDIVVVPGANHTWAADFDAEGFIRGADIVVLQMEVPLEIDFGVLRTAQKAGVKTVLNPSPWRPEALDLLPLVDILVLNETEAGLLLGFTAERVAADPKSAALAVLAKGPSTCVLTLGTSGYVTAEAGAASRFPAFQVKAVDSTAAGDTFTGYLAAGLAAGRSLNNAARTASAAAALCVTRRGAQSSIPTLAETESFLDRQGGPL